MFSVFRRKTIQILTSVILIVIMLSSFTSASALETETISRKDIVIDLGEGLTTDAQLTYPAVGDGPFPGILIIHGSGSTDMDGYIPAELTGTGEPVRHYLLMAEYLTERGFAVLRYNKRGVGLTGLTLDADIVMNKTVQDLIQDAEKALDVLMQQNQVDPSYITIIGRSEGAVIAPIVAIEKPDVKNVVLMGAGAHNLYDVVWYQVVERNMVMLDAIDTDSDGLTSVQEVLVLHPTLLNAMVENSTGEWLWKPGFDLDGDGFLNATGELRPRYVSYFEYLNQTLFQGSWYQSHFALDSTLEAIDAVPANVLILHGEGDQQGPVSEAFLLEQRLTEVDHPDHTLITYPDLGHTYYPVDRWLQLYGPPEDYVLSDLVSWLKNPEREIRVLEAQLEKNSDTTESLQIQLGDLNFELDRQASELGNLIEELYLESANMKDTVTELDRCNVEL
ncbi:MAG: alpha/beta hydrolase family protein, partial [Candidatus Thorarchaeota archaeon]